MWPDGDYNNRMRALSVRLDELFRAGIEVGFIGGPTDTAELEALSNDVARMFGVNLPPPYVSHLRSFGRVGVQSSSIFGRDIRPPEGGDPDQCGVLHRNLALARHPFLHEYFVLGEDDFFLYGVEKSTNRFVQVSKGNQTVERYFDTCEEMLTGIVAWMLNGLQH